MVAGICQGLAAMRCECILDGDWKSYRMRLEENIRERIQYMKMKNLTPEQLQHQQKLKENRYLELLLNREEMNWISMGIYFPIL